jgi:hypothetical protein
MRVSTFRTTDGKQAIDVRDLSEREHRHLRAFLAALARRDDRAEASRGDGFVAYSLDVGERTNPLRGDYGELL